MSYVEAVALVKRNSVCAVKTYNRYAACTGQNKIGAGFFFM